MSWTLVPYKKRMPSLKRPVLLEGLPGIGNVGKVAVDFIIDKIKAIKIYDVNSPTMPHSVFVTDNNLIEMPKIEVFYKKAKGMRDLIILTGDVQPMDEVACHEFCDSILDMAQDFGVAEIVTLGGIGLQEVDKSPKVYLTGNDIGIVDRYAKGTKVNREIFGVVGPIVGASGLLLGLARQRQMPAVSLLAETISHPLYLGIPGAREILRVLNTKLRLKLNLKQLDKEIQEMESELIQKTKELSQITKETALKKIEGKFGKEVTYIG